MQSIIGYSDDDRSDDDLKRLSPPKTLSKSKSKDSLLKPIPTVTAPRSVKAPASSISGSLVNEPRNREDADPSSEPKPAARSGKSKAGLNASIIRRTAIAQPSKPIEQPDASTSNSLHDREQETSPQQTPVEPSLQDLSLGPNPTPTSDGGELAQMRSLLQPPPIPGVEDFGIPPPSEGKVDPELSAKVSKFLALKRQGTHFNDILMRNKSFNNPHIYAKLVDFVDVDETGTNFPKNMWDPHDVQPEWQAFLLDAMAISTEPSVYNGPVGPRYSYGRPVFASVHMEYFSLPIATAQKKRSSEAAAAQAPGKRARIAFNNASASTSNAASTSGKHPSAIAEKSRQLERDRKSRVEGGREAGWSSGSGNNRHHPYPRNHTGDTNMGWMPRNHGERSGSKW